MVISTKEELFELLGKIEPFEGKRVKTTMWGHKVDYVFADDLSYEMGFEYFSQFLNPDLESEANLTLYIDGGQVSVDEELCLNYHGIKHEGREILLTPFCCGSIGENVGTVVIVPGDELTLTALFRSISSNLTRRMRGIVLHSSGVVYKDKCFLFLGESGSGKSTVVKLSGSLTTLSDEAILITESENGFRCWGSPYGAEHPGTNLNVELAGCLFLVQDKETYLEKLDGQEVVLRIAQQIWSDLSVIRFDPNNLSLCMKIASTVPCYNMHFELNDSFWLAIDKEFFGGALDECRSRRA